MTKEEIQKRINAIMVSDAPVKVKEYAIAELQRKLVSSTNKAKKQIEESQGDTYDIEI